LYAFPLARLFKQTGIRPVAALLIFQIFFFKQEYLTGEWIWNGFEGKTLAYLFLFWSLVFLLKNDYYKMAMFAAFATYCHVLVGGWFFMGIGIYMLLSRQHLVFVIKVCAVYLLITLPFIIYLANFILAGEQVTSDPSADWIYVYFRNRHHLVPTTKDHFWQNEWPFILLMVTSFGFLFKKWFSDQKLYTISLLVVAYNFILLTGIALTYLDSEGTLLKFYVLRMSSLCLLLELILAAYVLRKAFTTSNIMKRYSPVLLPVVLLLLLSFGTRKNYKRWKVTPAEKDYYEFVTYVKSQTEEADRFCFINYNDKVENVRFINDAERDRLVSFKMVPEGDSAILEWYERIENRKAIEENPAEINSLATRYQLDYLVSKTPLSIELVLTYQNDHYYLYHIRE
ncbi:MAG: hypothetical protein WBA74_19260, partial [Cyclobacteriaceae bacterium]